jgi:hypothetical protein
MILIIDYNFPYLIVYIQIVISNSNICFMNKGYFSVGSSDQSMNNCFLLRKKLTSRGGEQKKKEGFFIIVNRVLCNCDRIFYVSTLSVINRTFCMLISIRAASVKDVSTLSVINRTFCMLISNRAASVKEKIF